MSMIKSFKNCYKISHDSIFHLIHICLIFRVEKYVYETFDKTDIKIEVMKGQTMFEKEYPW